MSIETEDKLKAMLEKWKVSRVSWASLERVGSDLRAPTHIREEAKAHTARREVYDWHIKELEEVLGLKVPEGV